MSIKNKARIARFIAEAKEDSDMVYKLETGQMLCFRDFDTGYEYFQKIVDLLQKEPWNPGLKFYWPEFDTGSRYTVGIAFDGFLLKQVGALQ